MSEFVTLCRTSLMRSALLLLILLVPQTGGVLADEDQAQIRKRLVDVQEQIDRLQDSLEKARGRQGKLEGQLRRLERRIGRTAREIAGLEAEMNGLQQRLAELRADRSDQLEALEQQREALSRQVRAAYIGGRQEQLKLWLNQDDPATLGRLLVYYDYFNRARLERMAAVEALLVDLRQTEREIAAQTKQLGDKRDAKEAQHTALTSSRAERQQVARHLSAEIKRSGKRLESLREDEQRLQELLRSLSQALADLPADYPPFAKLKGRLTWPAAGRIAARFGERRGSTGLKWRGVLLSGPEGTPVQAVSRGRVAFADWMRGFGLLVIIDHGDGYMSLYGHNQSLFKSTGDWVEAGETIASVGNSGGGERAGLYFEIRRKGKPVDPSAWCVKPRRVAGNR
jgi:septal ring factor EnvC (AmiA/AmiB activator)